MDAEHASRISRGYTAQLVRQSVDPKEVSGAAHISHMSSHCATLQVQLAMVVISPDRECASASVKVRRRAGERNPPPTAYGQSALLGLEGWNKQCAGLQTFDKRRARVLNSSFARRPAQPAGRERAMLD
ncbi:uncharacterized protein PV09_05238 [Verruconis gallopava]|uniref:Uncharacterized protein n=1 Tax=Verruconis gallopava TaxID=253628 RepID=A0A0D2AA79_9PEZI|nr:uncharacterized protein PV09_05238 [Verruconis gallopava]KIW03470.1 hypothetical protein PV09_05238 [Verruconis gallopava]